MAEAFVNVTEGSGKKLHGWDRTIGANTIVDEFTLPGEFPYATYTVCATNILTTTAASHMLQLMAGASLNVRVRSIRVTQLAAPAAVTPMSFQVWRLSTAGTGGTAVNARPYDSADPAAGATGMTLPTAKGTETGNQLIQAALWLGTAAIPTVNNSLVWPGPLAGGVKPIIIPAGTANGIAIKNVTGLATSTLDIMIEFAETNFG